MTCRQQRFRDLQRCSVTTALLLGLLLGAGCDGATFRAARAQGTVSAYLRYLARYPKGSHRRDALEALDHARFQEATKAGSRYGYAIYLRLHRRGRHRAAARARLAQLALKAAKDSAGLELVLERYQATPQARVARRRLATLDARAALTSSDARLARRYLARYPRAPAARPVREHLAGLRYGALRDDPVEIEAFLQSFGGTSWASKALARLRKRLAAEVRSLCTHAALERFEARFPDDRGLLALRAVVRQRRLRDTLIRLDLVRLGMLERAAKSKTAKSKTATSKTATSQTRPKRGAKIRQKGIARRRSRSEAAVASVAEVLAHCRRRPADCERLRRLARRALPWRSAKTFGQLRSALLDADLANVWQALEEVSWLTSPRAATLLAEQLASSRPGNIWPAARGLRRWLSRTAVTTRARWLGRELARKPRRANADEVQRYGFIALLAGKRRLGARLLRGLLDDPARRLVAAYLLVQGTRQPQLASGPLLAAARRRLNHLRGSFPRRLAKDSAVAGTLVERELFALLQIVRATNRLRGSPLAERLEQRIRALLRTWRVELRRANSRFVFAKAADVRAEVAAHRRGRSAALRTLLKRRGAVAISVSRAVCSTLAGKERLVPPAGLAKPSGPGALCRSLLGRLAKAKAAKPAKAKPLATKRSK